MYVRSVLEHLAPDENTYLVYCFDSGDPIVELGIESRIRYQVVSTKTLATATISAGKATCTLPLLAKGSHAINAVYAGNTSYAGATSASVTLKVS